MSPNSLLPISSSSSPPCSNQNFQLQLVGVPNPIINRRPLPCLFSSATLRIKNPSIPTSYSSSSSSQSRSRLRFSNLDESESAQRRSDDNGNDGIEIEIVKIGKNSRRIRSKIAIDATLLTLWNILTDYERLSDFIPGLALSQLLEKGPNFARLFQIGEQNLAFGLKFNAKGIVDCYERELESLPFGQRRDIEFKMIEGDFQLFEGKWSIEQCKVGKIEDSESLIPEQFNTTLSYVVDVEPKLWLPVRLVEGRLCKEIKTNLSCIREEAQKVTRDLEIDLSLEENAQIVYSTLVVDKELQPDKVKRHMSVSNGKLSVHFEAVEAKFLRASFSAFVDVLTLATKTIEEFGQGMEL